MTVSLIICTRNRARQLSDTLGKLEQLQVPESWDLVLVDNGSTDDTKAVIEQCRNIISGKLISISEPQAGVARARNLGWKTSRNPYIAFIDDDCYPDPHYLDAIIKCFEEDTRLGFIGGRVLLYDSSDYHITVQEGEQRKEIPPGTFIPAGFIHGANFAFRRAALESVGGFDENFGPGSLFRSGDDVEILARMSAAGWYGAYDPRPLVYHHHRRKGGNEIFLLMERYDYGRGAYYAKCLLNPRLRTTYLKHWFRHIRTQPLQRTMREIISASRYMMWVVVSR